MDLKARLTPELIREIASYAKSQKRDVAAALASFEKRSTPAAYWLEASLLEQAGRHEDAAEVLESLTDQSWGEERALRLLAIARNRKHSGAALMQAARAATTNRTLTAIDKLADAYPATDQAKNQDRTCRYRHVGTVDAGPSRALSLLGYRGRNLRRPVPAIHARDPRSKLRPRALST